MPPVPLGQHIFDEGLEQVDREIMSKIEIREVVADLLHPLLPHIVILFRNGVDQPFALLREHGLFPHLRFQPLARKHPVAVELLAHMPADLPRQYRVLGDLEVDGENLRDIQRMFWHRRKKPLRCDYGMLLLDNGAGRRVDM